MKNTEILGKEKLTVLLPILKFIAKQKGLKINRLADFRQVVMYYKIMVN